MITLLLTVEDFTSDEALVEGDAYRHLFRARRVATGTRLRVVDGRGHARWAKVVDVDRWQGRLRLGDDAPSHEPARRVDLLVAVHRKERASWLVEKATEIGVFSLRFLHTERAPRTLGEGTFERFRRVSVAAVEQCQRARVPEVTGMHAWEELPNLLGACAQRYFLDAAGQASDVAGGVGPVGLLVGPEGGWTGGERDALLALGCRPLSLGPRVLRVETAAVVGASLILCR